MVSISIRLEYLILKNRNMKSLKMLFVGLLAMLSLSVNAQTYLPGDFSSKDLYKVAHSVQIGAISGTGITRMDTLNARVLRELGKVSLIQSQVATSVKQDTANARLSLIRSYATAINSKFLDQNGANVFLRAGTNLSYLYYLDVNTRDIGGGSVFNDQGDGNSYLRYLKRRAQNQYSNNVAFGPSATLAALKGLIDTYEAANPTLWCVEMEIESNAVGVYEAVVKYSAH